MITGGWSGKREDLQMAELWLKHALRNQVPDSAQCVYQPGDHVLLWGETLVTTRTGECIGPFKVVLTDINRNLANLNPEGGSQLFFSLLNSSRTVSQIKSLKLFSPKLQIWFVFFKKSIFVKFPAQVWKATSLSDLISKHLSMIMTVSSKVNWNFKMGNIMVI